MTKYWPIQELGLTHKLIDAYLDNSAEIQPYISHQPTIQGLINSAEARHKSSHTIDRSALVEELSKSFSSYDDGSDKFIPTRQNIASLANPNTFTITTGQQLHLFLGPAYFINKIFTCIKLAKNFNKEQINSKAVPVFWLASEDHDTEEIENVELFGTSYKCSLKKNQITGVQKTDQIKSLIIALEERLGEESQSHNLFLICKEAYRKFPTLSEATSYIIYSLFAEYGIVVIDANNPLFKEQAEFIFKKEIENETSTQIQSSVRTLFDKQKWHYQVMPRGTNLFKIDENGKRSTVSKKEFNSSIDYSPNALLRPLYQETILPNIAYVGGMAETSYWLQLKPVFDSYDIPFPVIWNRDSIHITTKKKAKQLLENEYTISEIAFFKEAEFKAQYAKSKVPLKLQNLLRETESELVLIGKDVNTKNWESLLKDYKLLQDKIKKEIRSIKSDVLEGDIFKNKLKIIEKMYGLYFNKAHFQERNKSNLSLASNFNQINTLREAYLNSPLLHSQYYLLEI